MTKKDAFRFFDLPTELRLDVYRRVLTAALADGRTSDAGSLYRACRTTNLEMGPLISTVRTVLDLKHAWRVGHTALKGRVKGELRLEIPPEHTYAKPLTEFTISASPESKCVTRYMQAKRKAQKHTSKILKLALSSLLSPLGYELRGRYSSGECLTSDSLFYFIFIATWGRKFIKQTKESGQVEQLVLYKDPLEETWIAKVRYTATRLFVDQGPRPYVVYWDATEVVDGSISRKFGVDFKPFLPVPEGDYFAWRWKPGRYNEFR
jgi:hypothetical protein